MAAVNIGYKKNNIIPARVCPIKYAEVEYNLLLISRKKMGLEIGICKTCAIDIMMNWSLAAEKARPSMLSVDF